MAITLGTRFAEELAKLEHEVCATLELTTGYIKSTQTTAADWAANNGETAVDYTNPDFIGSVVLESDTIPDITQNSTTAQRGLWTGGLSPPGTYTEYYQTFQQVSGADVYLDTVSLWLLNGTTGRTATFYVKIRNAAGSDLTSEVSNALAAGASGQYDFDFSAFNLLLDDSTTYQIYVRVVMSAWEFAGAADIYIDDTNVYANGALYTSAGVPVDSGNADLRMNISFFGYYYTTPGSIETKTFDLGEVPTNNGTFIVYDNKNGQTLTYILETSATGTWTGEEVSLGTYADGDAITTLNQYYRVLGSFSTTDLGVSPELQEITLSFAASIKFSDTNLIGYAPDIQSISTLNSKISDFHKTTIGQVTVALARTAAVESYFLTGGYYPKNKEAILRFGFIIDDFASDGVVVEDIQNFSEADFEPVFWGIIDTYSLTDDNSISVVIKNVSNLFDRKIPLKESSSVPTSLVYTADHPIEVMLDILQNQLEMRDSFVNTSSFTTVQTALPGWVVTRTIDEDQENAKVLLEELRILMNCYLLFSALGEVSIKQWNAAETAADTWTDSDFISKSWDFNGGELINQQIVYYAWAGTGDEYSDFSASVVAADLTSQGNYGDVIAEDIVKDKWTASGSSSQVTAFTSARIARYKNPPAIFNCVTDWKKFRYEPGDIINITTARAIGSAIGGVEDEPFQITSKNVNKKTKRITFELLQVAG